MDVAKVVNYYDYFDNTEKIFDTAKKIRYLNSPPNQDTLSKMTPFSIATCNELL